MRADGLMRDAARATRKRYEDRDVTAGGIYDYRLAVTESGQRRTLGDVRVQIPTALAFALEGARPNPSSGPFTLPFALPSHTQGQLNLHDVSGHLVWTRHVGGAAGRHLVALGDALPPGVYLARLTHQVRSISRRMVRSE